MTQEEKTTLKARARRLIYATLETQLIEFDDNTCLYHKDEIEIGNWVAHSWTDALVAEKCNIEIPGSGTTEGMVAGIRARAWGKFASAPTLEEENAILRKEIAELKAQLQQPELSIVTTTVDNIKSTVDDLFSYSKDVK